jgi:serine/threonine protein kinase
MANTRFCERCERETLDGNLWCQEVDCPAESGYSTFAYGDYLGDLKVTKLVRVWRSAALYEAERGETTYLLKVAHPGVESADRLKREAVLLQRYSPNRIKPGKVLKSFLPTPRAILPVPVSPFPSQKSLPYGEITYQGEPRVFSVFEHAGGKLLSDLLLEQPQLWHTQAAWIILTVARALRPIVAANLCHLSLTPEIILVDQDKEGHYRPLLLDLGLILEPTTNLAQENWSALFEPAYTPPELLSHTPNGALSLSADVYSLGIIFYEMLSGNSAYETRLLRDDQLKEEITENRQPLFLGRPELEHSGVASVVERAVAGSGRYANLLDFSKALAKIYSSPPRERRPLPRRTVILIILAVILLLAIGVFAAITILQVVLSNTV